MNYVYNFDMFQEKLSAASLSKEATAYLYLTWLGLSDNEICNSCYNSHMRILEWDDRTVFIKENTIADFLSALGIQTSDIDVKGASSEAEKSGVSPALVRKMGFFNIKYEQKKLGQPEDIVRMKEMARNIGQSLDELNSEYQPYKAERNKL